MKLKKLSLPYFMKGHFQCSIDNTFFSCDGLNRVFKPEPTGVEFEVYIITYTSHNANRTVGQSILNFTQLDDDVYLSYEEVNYKLKLINKKEMQITDGVNNFVITRVR